MKKNKVMKHRGSSEVMLTMSQGKMKKTDATQLYNSGAAKPTLSFHQIVWSGTNVYIWVGKIFLTKKPYEITHD